MVRFILHHTLRIGGYWCGELANRTDIGVKGWEGYGGISILMVRFVPHQHPTHLWLLVGCDELANRTGIGVKVWEGYGGILIRWCGSFLTAPYALTVIWG
ncbi:hypothetical protein EH243_15765 [Amphritea opalescens]|uniref:Uncharacterized protein n=1 Tax=Amphritea opalescens TaxID=2490544 RepID=A0A430KML1_9GAMM|nr:hypothetical protein [Amphritea opalescens]RTE64700.1 hypothetical protein EH243_15765 [Amphritea opalescens]